MRIEDQDGHSGEEVVRDTYLGQLIRELAQDIQAETLANLGLTAKDVELGMYFANCPKHGRYWAEDGCENCRDEAEQASELQ